MNKTEMIHNERKEYWRELITRCDASGMNQTEWCQENGICSTSMSKWRRTIWREEEAEKEIAAAHEERCFVEMTAELDKGNEAKETMLIGKTQKRVSTKSAGQNRQGEAEPRLAKPDAVIGYRDYMVGVYEHTSSQVLQKVMEVLKYA